MSKRLKIPRLELSIDDAVALAGTRFEYKELKSLQIKVFKDAVKPFDRELRARYKSQFLSYGKGRKIASPPLFYKGIEEFRGSNGLPALLIMPKNNGAIWFERGTNKRKTRKGYRRGRISANKWGKFKVSFDSTKSIIGKDIEQNLGKVLNSAINNALKKNYRIINSNG